MGTPDYFGSEVPTKTTLGPTQSRFYYTFSGSIPGSSYVDLQITTVTPGTRLFISYATVSCDASCIQSFMLLENSYMFAMRTYDIFGEISFPESANFPSPAGRVITMRIYNNDTETHTFLGGVYGTSEQI